MKLNQLLFTERFSAEERVPQIKRIDDDRRLTQMKSSEKNRMARVGSGKVETAHSKRSCRAIEKSKNQTSEMSRDNRN